MKLSSLGRLTILVRERELLLDHLRGLEGMCLSRFNTSCEVVVGCSQSPDYKLMKTSSVRMHPSESGCSRGVQ